ncbi:MAG TPA: hypothetical protein VHB21_03510, partial [Minicystis sp.]|nr:hypothetical protein [Minicystis sp.]
MIDKRELLKRVGDALAREIEATRKAALDAAAGATHPDARPENDKDTRGLELSYLARGQAQRVAELEHQAERLAAILPRDFAKTGAPAALGALVDVDLDGGEQRYLIAPCSGGLKLDVGGETVVVVTPESPVGA